MKQFVMITLVALAAAISGKAQTAGSATVFSQDGEKFWVVVNGIKQNASPQTNVKITGLDQPGYKFKIIFDDETIKSIDQNIMTQDVDGKFNDVTYVVKKGKNGYVMRVNSFQPASGNTSAENGQVSMPYSTSEPKSNTSGSGTTSGTTTTVTQQTTTSQNPNGNAAIGIGINDPSLGVNFNMNVNTTGMNTTGNSTMTTTTTTTTTHSSSSNTMETASNVPPVKEEKEGCRMPMNAADFNAAKKSVEAKSFEESRLQVAKQFTKANCLTCAQVKEVLALFSFEQSKLDFAKFAYDYTTDKNKYYTINDAFTFESSITELDNYISSKSK